jgi:hypothetical protein
VRIPKRRLNTENDAEQEHTRNKTWNATDINGENGYLHKCSMFHLIIKIYKRVIRSLMVCMYLYLGMKNHV